MELNICQVCDSRYAVVKLDKEKTKSKEEMSLCLKCYLEKSQKGELPSINEMGIDIIKQIINSFPKDEQFKKKETEKKTPAYEQKENLFVLKFGKDLTSLAFKGEIDPVVGRKKEIERTVLVLSRRSKNNPVLLGEPGVGKTAIAEGLAQRIVTGDVPENLKTKRIISLNLSSVIAGTKYRGEFEERMKKILEEVIDQKNIILLIDEFHTLIGAGGAEGAVDASNIMKPMLARGELQIIGATTREEYRKYVEKDAALERRFQPIQVEEPSVEEAIEILKGVQKKYEEYHGVTIEEEAVDYAVTLAQKYISDRFLPDKAIDLMDEACAMKKIAYSTKSEEIVSLEEALKLMLERKKAAIMALDFELTKEVVKEEEKIVKKLKKLAKKEQEKKEHILVNKDDIAIIVGNWTGVPVTQLNKEEKERLKTLAPDLKKYVKGQDEAIEVISRSIRRNKMGLKDPKRPIGVFLLLGPTGVGKTELAKSVAKLVYGSEDNMIRFDMSEYMEKHTVSKLIGSPPGYVGHEDEGKLTKVLRRKPYSLVLFDEIEKADPNVLNLLLQLFEDGRITDSKGRVINAKNAIFLMTSNAGSDVYAVNKKKLGFGANDEEQKQDLQERVKGRLKDYFKPEFLNRLDDVLMFNQLSEENMVEIARKMLDEVKEQLMEQEIDLSFSEAFVKHIAKVGYDPEFGARTLRREIDKMKDLVADKLIEEEKLTLSVGVKKEKIVIR